MPTPIAARLRRRVSRSTVEAIEPRVLLSTYVVTNLNDSGPGSLRDAIQQANADPGADMITFASGLAGIIPATSGPLTINDASGTTSIVGNGLNEGTSTNVVTLPVIAIAAGASGSITDAEMNGLQNSGSAQVTECSSDRAPLSNNGGSLAVTGSALVSLSGQGGAVSNHGGLVTLQGDLIYQDDSSASDAAVFSDGGSVDMRNSTIFTNGSEAGLGIAVTAGNLMMVQDTLWTRTDDLSSHSANTILVNCTLISIQTDSSASTGNLTLYNTIVEGSVQGTLDQHLSPGELPSSHDLIGTNTAGGLINGVSGNIVGINPQLNGFVTDFGGPVPTLLPMPGSPAIDAGSDALATDVTAQPPSPLATDQRGFPRVYNGSVDIGATEFQPVIVNSAIDADYPEMVPPGACTLRAAVNVASTSPNSMAIRFDPTLFRPTSPQTIRMNSYIELFGPASGTLSIDGPGPDALVLSGANLIFKAFAGNISISGLGITGTVNSDAIDNVTASLTLRDVDFFGCQGICVDNYENAGAALIVTDCNFSNNSANGGVDPGVAAGILNLEDATVTGCMFSRNTGLGSSGAIFNTGNLVVTSSTFVDNSAQPLSAPRPGLGGAIGSYEIGGGAMILAGDTFANNSASSGGAVEGDGGNSNTINVVNCTFVDNSATTAGAALSVNSPSLVLTNTTIVENRDVTGGAVEASGRTTLNNTIVSSNLAPDGTPADISVAVTGSNNLIGTGGSGGLVNGVNGNIVGVADPKLGPLGNYGGPTQTIPLLPGSPALDAGSNALAVDGSGNPLTTDQRGLPRIFNGTVDIGAYEAQPPALAGDVNYDGKVDFSDLLILAQHYGSTTQPLWENGDLTGDGAVAFPDLLIVAQNYGSSSAALSPQSLSDFVKITGRATVAKRTLR